MIIGVIFLTASLGEIMLTSRGPEMTKRGEMGTETEGGRAFMPVYLLTYF